ncbi:MAG TPA: bifunctional enoyl-CoA hydratase/phosphate acetyltransferase [Plasticicumulans sp.]|uniref:bifunctional enoyl-CoA hydratase/phosphate acetyltransferase n=1 Tax=Plasticicumulans sp. TaxID=2307179 RepID=UPI002C67635B|nr:bifunctional enoyl-CoA hydratase/phosphate acetyltransferase [Plasticicumulans sp.]MBS0600209.1 bifunctional enoyl-CoA hydratase/phosphate acetyltransferase [Pseudomonadota bacterium]HMW30165.1 bifunctional enoyl-CoA hydratase/phosphate acetyltransferase [Plasticicumulans sp.]HMZ09842.1 bifunctional enoyl-CoA hydratase/phosphate acetyltransferase [Plasticicumulans sp.]HND97931.1 bifunctional enoyl-CoA hydratase/phosphate acetyltransferase [Plasticicumulans sp.]HNF66168.1 bifunctional enoyl-
MNDETHLIQNRTFDEIEIGQSASHTRTLNRRDIELFALLSNDLNPTHIDEEFARGAKFSRVVGHSMWSAGLISGVLGTELPGPGTVYRGQTLNFHGVVSVGDVITATVTVSGKNEAARTIELDCRCTDQTGRVVLDGRAEVYAPPVKIHRAAIALPEVHFSEHGARHKKLVDEAARLPAIPTAVVHPVDQVSLEGAVRAAEAGLIVPLLVGPEAKIRATAEQHGLHIKGFEIVDVPHSHAAAETGVALVREGRAEVLMKGSLHTDEFMGAVVAKATGLRTGRRVSHAFIMDVPTYPKPLLITDAAINIYPDLMDKADIVQNAIELMHALGVAQPKVAILSAVETVTPKIGSTMDAAALCKMADRGQIKGAILDGPLAFDNAISKSAAKTKGIVSVVPGEADILLAPDLEAGNMIAKQLEYLADAAAAGVVLGARCPIVLTSRADGTLARMASCAVAALMAHAKRGSLK